MNQVATGRLARMSTDAEEEFRQDLRERIYQGNDRPKIPIAELARQAGVVPASVYNVLNGTSPSKSKSARDVLAALEKLENDRSEHPADYERTESTTDDLAVVELYDVYGVGRVVVRAREGHVAEQVAETLRGIRAASGQLGGAE